MKNRNRLQCADGSDFFCYGDEENGHCACTSVHLTTANQSEIREAYLVSVRNLFLASAETNDKFFKASFQAYQVTVEAVATATVPLDGTCELSHRITSLSVYLEAISLLMGVPPSENLISYSVITFPSFISLL